MNYILSYPRSGNTWLRYIIEFLTDRATVGVHGSSATIVGPLLNKDTKPLFRKSHHSQISPDKLILLVRNFKECIIRHTRSGVPEKGQIASYVKMLEFYDNFEGEKLLLYYEDLIDLDEEYLNCLMDFIDRDNHKVPEFLENLEEHVEECIRIYNTNGNPSVTKGKSKIHHSKNINNKLWDNAILQINRELVERYLNRYLNDV